MTDTRPTRGKSGGELSETLLGRRFRAVAGPRMVHSTMIARISLVLGLSSLAAVGLAAAASEDDLRTRDSGRAAYTQPFDFIKDKAASANFRSGADLFRLPWSDGGEG